MSTPKQIKAIICPLDWGLGHATRCIPLINELNKNGIEVLIAGDGQALALLKLEFPNLKTIFLKGYRIRFSKKIPLSMTLLFNLPRIIFRLVIEHYQLARIIKQNNIDLVISDNRYGLWNKDVYSVFVTHQPNILPPDPLKFMTPILRKITRSFMKLYNETWIPDNEGTENISGILSHGYKLPSNVRFIGVLSRFASLHYSSEQPNAAPIKQIIKKHSSGDLNKNADILAIISGPEPQRTVFEEKVIEQLRTLQLKSIIIRGIPNDHTNDAIETNSRYRQSYEGNLQILNHVNTYELYTILKQMPIVICRGGYSTLMDLAITGNKVICIPTPGQTEQDYLARKGHNLNQSLIATQESFSIKDCLLNISGTKGYIIDQQLDNCQIIIRSVIDNINNRKLS